MKNEFLKEYKKWLLSTQLSDDEKSELEHISNNKLLIEEMFGSNLEFGTAGLRGVMDLGTNRMNKYVVRHATQGLANYLLSEFDNPSVAIAYDSRNNSKLFAEETASVLAANNIRVYIFKELMPVPSLSFATRKLKCSAGVVITASHNPKQYNGYKVYGSDGCQITLDAANKVLANINKLDMFDDIKYSSFAEKLQQKSIIYISDELIEEYYSSVMKQSIKDEKSSPRTLKITYTPLHGAGYKPVSTILKRDGFKNIDIVEEQKLPDGNFTTCPYPNPEIKEAMDLGMKLMVKNHNDILVATDPDSDRAGVAINQNGEAIILTGNEIGILLFDFIYHARKEENKLPLNPVVVKSIVSTDLVNLMGNKWHVEVRDVLTGFKFIGEQILFLEQNNEEHRFILGFEESYGYLTNVDVRDKDAVNGVLLICEMANYYKSQGLTLLDRLNELYDEFGRYQTITLPYEFTGLDGKEKMIKFMNDIRISSFPNKIGNISGIIDYEKGVKKVGNVVSPTNLPKSNVVKFILSDNETITFRPSGTEPKLKAYVFCKAENLNKIKNIVDQLIIKI